MPAPDAITVTQLSRLVGTSEAPILIDVRTAEDRAADPRLVPASLLRSHEDVHAWAPAPPSASPPACAQPWTGRPSGMGELRAESGAKLWPRRGVEGGSAPLVASMWIAAAACRSRSGKACALPPARGIPTRSSWRGSAS